jgi:hypothetical protein
LKLKNMRTTTEYQWRNLPSDPFTLHCNLYNPGDRVTVTPIPVGQYGQ